MNRDTIIYCSCTFLLGLVIGALLIGPHLGKRGAAESSTAVSGGTATSSAAPPPGGNPMNAIREQIAALKEKVARDPKDASALAQLGNMYMDAAKFAEAAGYYEQSLAAREDPNVRIDLGICYKNVGQLDKALAAFHRAGEESNGQWQPLYNEAIVLGEMRRFDEARAIVARLKKVRPDDPEVTRLQEALSQTGIRD